MRTLNPQYADLSWNDGIFVWFDLVLGKKDNFSYFLIKLTYSSLMELGSFQWVEFREKKSLRSLYEWMR